MSSFQTLPGFREFYPEAFSRRQYIFQLWRQAARAYGFLEYDAPVLEPLELYTTKSGEEIEAQLFSFADKGGRPVALRPELTPSLARMVAERASSLKRPIKWFNIGEHYRYERQQRGRLRAFFQLNVDLLGEAGPEAEVELIALLIQCLTSFGLTEKDFYVRLSDRDLWSYFLEATGFDPVQAEAMLSVVDKFEKAGEAAFTPFEEKFGPVSPVIRERIADFKGTRSLQELELKLKPLAGEAGGRVAVRLEEWRQLLGGLDAMGLGAFVQVDLGVVRGLAYYTGFVFEAFDRQGDFRALAGGGRYNRLVEKLGGPDLPASGFAIGDVVLSEMLKEKGLLPSIVPSIDIYVIIGGPQERKAAFADIGRLRAAAYSVEYPMKEAAFGKQFKAADQSGARVALIYGQEELSRGAVKVRDLAARSEREVPREQLFDCLRELFGGA